MLQAFLKSHCLAIETLKIIEVQLPDQTSMYCLFIGKYKENEAIEFSFDLNKDVPEDVAQEMVCRRKWWMNG